MKCINVTSRDPGNFGAKALKPTHTSVLSKHLENRKESAIWPWAGQIKKTQRKRAATRVEGAQNHRTRILLKLARQVEDLVRPHHSLGHQANGPGVAPDMVQADHAPEAGVAQGIFHGTLVRHQG